MNENEQNLHRQKGQAHNKDHHNQRPYWKGIHRNWLFWVFLFLMFAGIIYYIMSVDFLFAPHKQLKQPSENSRTK
jgi:hypothetical protein